MKQHRALALGLTVVSASCLLLALKIQFKLSSSLFMASWIVAVILAGNAFYPESLRRSYYYIFRFKKLKVAVGSIIRKVSQKIGQKITETLGKQMKKLIDRKNEIVSFRNKSRIKTLLLNTKKKLDTSREVSATLKRENFLLKASNKRQELEIGQLRKELEGMQGLWLGDSSRYPTTVVKVEKSIWEKFKMGQHSFIMPWKKSAYKEREVPQEI